MLTLIIQYFSIHSTKLENKKQSIGGGSLSNTRASSSLQEWPVSAVCAWQRLARH